MKYIYSTCFLLAAVLFASFSASAQETQERVVDEVVAQVNEGVVTLSRIKRETKAIVDAEVQQGKTRDVAQKMVDEKQGELIANIINEELLVQKAKELGLDKEVDASLNQRFLQIMKQYNMKSLDALYEEMQKTGVDPAGNPRGLAKRGNEDHGFAKRGPIEGLLGIKRQAAKRLF